MYYNVEMILNVFSCELENNALELMNKPVLCSFMSLLDKPMFYQPTSSSHTYSVRCPAGMSLETLVSVGTIHPATSLRSTCVFC